MFRIEVFCEDKNFAKVFHALTGLVISIKAQPVANAKKGNGAVVAKTNGDKIELFADWCKKHHLKSINPTMLRDFTISIGMAPGSYSSVLRDLLKAKAVRKIAGSKSNKTTYAVTL